MIKAYTGSTVHLGDTQPLDDMAQIRHLAPRLSPRRRYALLARAARQLDADRARALMVVYAVLWGVLVAVVWLGV